MQVLLCNEKLVRRTFVLSLTNLVLTKDFSILPE
jgi:hypothetical protein